MTTLIKWSDGRVSCQPDLPTFSIGMSQSLPIQWQLSAVVRLPVAGRRKVPLMVSDSAKDVNVRLMELMVICDLARESGEVMELEAMG